MKVFVINEAELEALRGVPDLAFRVYINLRGWMDYRTGVVGGGGAVISYQRLAENTEIIRERGSTMPDERRTKEQLRAAVAQLVRRGMLKPIKIASTRYVFCYRLLLAKIYQNEEPHDKKSAFIQVEKAAKSLPGLNFKPIRCGAKTRGILTHEPHPSGKVYDKRDDFNFPGKTPWEQMAADELQRRLYPSEIYSANIVTTIKKLAAIFHVREISEAELDRALALARRCKGVVSIPAYAVEIIRRGGLKQQLTRESHRRCKSTGKAKKLQTGKIVEEPIGCIAPVQTPSGIARGLSMVRSCMMQL